MVFFNHKSSFRPVALVAVALLGMLASAAPADAACTPAAGNNVTASCTGTTTNQGGGAPGTSAALDGYGTGNEDNINISVVTGATLTGTNNGISILNGSVTNAGSISGAPSASQAPASST